MDERKKALLKEIVENYIKLAKPIGSKSLCKKLKCSSATIRNEMVKLEELGFIEKNHISSGRIPSEMGYKYYVEHLMEIQELTEKDARKLETIFQNHQLAIPDAIQASVEIISEMTNYTSIILGKNSVANSLQQVSIIPLQGPNIVALICTDKGIVENKKFTLPKNINVAEVVKTSELINKMLIGTPIDQVSERLEFEIKPVIAKKVRDYEAIYSIFKESFTDFASKANETVAVSGTKYLLNSPEYDDINKIREIMNKFNDQNLIDKIDRNTCEEGVNIYIGNDSEFDKDVTVIKTHYNINGSEGTIAIIGPKRMQYDRVVSLLTFLNRELNKGDDDE